VRTSPGRTPVITPADRGLLRDELLEELMLRRPKSKEDWFRLIAQHLRTQTDLKQVGRYLPRVLQVIADASV
jgi:hypothetical protein